MILIILFPTKLHVEIVLFFKHFSQWNNFQLLSSLTKKSGKSPCSPEPSDES